MGGEQAPQGSGVASGAPAPGPGVGFDFWHSPSVIKALPLLGWGIDWPTLSSELLCQLLTLLCILGDISSG